MGGLLTGVGLPDTAYGNQVNLTNGNLTNPLSLPGVINASQLISQDYFNDRPWRLYWLMEHFNNNPNWNLAIARQAAIWYPLGQSHPELVKALAKLADTHPVMAKFNELELQHLTRTFPKTTSAVHKLLKTRSRLAMDLYQNLHHINYAAQQTGDQVVQNYLRNLTEHALSISLLIEQLSKHDCQVLNAELIKFFMTRVLEPKHSHSLTQALNILLKHHPHLLKDLNARGNKHQEIITIFDSLSIHPDLAVYAAQKSKIVISQRAATYSLPVFFAQFGLLLEDKQSLR